MKKQVIVSAGDAITARLVQEAGFDGIWISGFEACARLGLPDNGSITMTEMLNVAKPIVDSVRIPVWVDVDTGYGNFRRTVREFEKIGVYGICVEDNIPEQKINSLWGGDIPIMDMSEFAAKINVERKKIRIMARTEALIRGHGSADARKRLECYRRNGADFLLPHARKSTDIIRVYSKKIPFAIVPTMFPNLKNNDLFNMGYSMIIWANQTERVKIKSTRKFLEKLNFLQHAGESGLYSSLDDMKGLMPHD